MNLVTGFDSTLELEELVDTLRDVEARNARQGAEKRYGPRILDIDIFDYGDMIGDEDPIELPRDEIMRQADPLLSLAGLAPNTRHPAPGECYADMCTRLNLDTPGMHPVKLSPGPGQ